MKKIFLLLIPIFLISGCSFYSGKSGKSISQEVPSGIKVTESGPTQDN